MHGHPLVATTVTTATVYPHAPALHVAVHYVDIIISSSLNVNPKRCTMEFGFFGFFPKSMCKIDDERATNHTERRRECTRLHSFTFPWPAFVAVNITLGIELQARAL